MPVVRASEGGSARGNAHGWWVLGGGAGSPFVETSARMRRSCRACLNTLLERGGRAATLPAFDFLFPLFISAGQDGGQTEHDDRVGCVATP